MRQKYSEILENEINFKYSFWDTLEKFLSNVNVGRKLEKIFEVFLQK